MGELAAPGRARVGGEAGVHWFSVPIALSRGAVAAGYEIQSPFSSFQVGKEI